MKKVLTLILIGLSVNGFSQINLNAYKEKYKGVNYVHVSHQETVTMNMVKGEVEISSKFVEELLALNDEGIVALGEDEIDYSSFEVLGKITAYSYLATEKGAKKVNAINFKTRSAAPSEGIFHDDMKTVSFQYPGISQGSMRYLEYTVKYTENRFPQGFGFFSGGPLEKAIFTIDHDTSIHLSKLEYNFEGAGIKFEEKVVKNRRIWTWSRNDIAAVKRENFAVPLRYYGAGVYTQLSHYYKDGKRVNVLSNADDLVKWYATNVEEVLAEEASENLKKITNDAIAGLTNEFDKVQAIYYWVQDNIKYIAFEAGVEGFVPRRANDICEKRFGDCKDMAVIIYKMLEVAGIKGHVVWIGTRDIPFRYSQFPSAIVDNHMIAAYVHEGKTYFLDATSELQPMNLVAYGIQGKEALIYTNPTTYRIEEVGVPSTTDSKYLQHVKFKIDNRKIVGSSIQTCTGYYSWLLRMDAKYANKNKSLEKQMEVGNQLGNNTFRITSASRNDDSPRDSTLVMKFDFDVNNYVSSYGDEVYVNMILDKEIYKEKALKADRVAPFEMDFYSDNVYVNELEVPADMKVKSLPAEVKYESDAVDLYVTYEQKNDQVVVMKMRTVFKFLMLKPSEFSQWNGFVEACDKATSKSVVLIKK